MLAPRSRTDIPPAAVSDTPSRRGVVETLHVDAYATASMLANSKSLAARPRNTVGECLGV